MPEPDSSPEPRPMPPPEPRPQPEPPGPGPMVRDEPGSSGALSRRRMLLLRGRPLLPHP